MAGINDTVYRKTPEYVAEEKASIGEKKKMFKVLLYIYI